MNPPRSIEVRAALAARLWLPGLAACGAIAGLVLAGQDAPPPAGEARPAATPAAQGGTAQANPATKKLFVQLCAPCHGETGDGNGTTKLERPARSFKDGGFSYGNTSETIQRTIKNGIPGSLMPSFEAAVNEADRKSLAAYVIALGPEQISADVKDTELLVTAKALVVRGKLPPIVPGALEQTRGLLIGTPDGLSFEYRVDDVRLLGVRQGRFVNRNDWNGRGGDALEPLGKVVCAYQLGSPPPLFYADPGTNRLPLRARLTSSWLRGGQAGLEYDLALEGKPDVALAKVVEIPAGYRCELGTGTVRRMLITRSDRERVLGVEVLTSVPATREMIQGAWYRAAETLIPVGDQLWELIGIRSPDMDDLALPPVFNSSCWFTKSSTPRTFELEVLHLPLVTWGGTPAELYRKWSAIVEAK